MKIGGREINRRTAAYTTSALLALGSVGCLVTDVVVNPKPSREELHQQLAVTPYAPVIIIDNLAELEAVYKQQAQLAKDRVEELYDTNRNELSGLEKAALGLMGSSAALAFGVWGWDVYEVLKKPVDGEE